MTAIGTQPPLRRFSRRLILERFSPDELPAGLTREKTEGDWDVSRGRWKSGIP